MLNPLLARKTKLLNCLARTIGEFGFLFEVHKTVSTQLFHNKLQVIGKQRVHVYSADKMHQFKYLRLIYCVAVMMCKSCYTDRLFIYEYFTVHVYLQLLLLKVN